MALAGAGIAAGTASSQALLCGGHGALCCVPFVSAGAVRPGKPERFWGTGSLPRAGAV